eukprot:CAMPEP_0174734906 /NCGR_PEP_ID=MMETSP1094-20130205/64083_1 /TAXON_ID=156173 /ORGANISM="Chrysochromulina brevifilum, Strain UTEX LB 985" /LENGTH=91 /DNA_ID=CAMNT_0015937801 /DNA_START=282 /DNA_END=554 /DNA_ORIENTATION=+
MHAGAALIVVKGIHSSELVIVLGSRLQPMHADMLAEQAIEVALLRSIAPLKLHRGMTHFLAAKVPRWVSSQGDPATALASSQRSEACAVRT